MINPALVGTWTTGSDPDTCYAEFLTRGEFRIQHCRGWQQHQFYPRLVYTHCGGTDLAWVQPSGCGVVYAASVAHRSAQKGGPYT